MQIDVGCRVNLFFGHCDLEVVGADLDPAERHEGEMTADDAFLDRGELRYVGLDVDIDVL